MDWDKVEQLLNIIAKAAQHGPQLASLVQKASADLQEHVAAANKANAEKAAADAEKVGRQKAEAANKAREEVDKQAAEDEEQKAAREAQLQSNAKAAETAGDVGDTTAPVRRI